MTMDEFRATRTWTEDISKATGYDYGPGLAGYVYAAGLHIFRTFRSPEWSLQIMGREKLSDDLADLEWDLYGHGISEGFISEPANA